MPSSLSSPLPTPRGSTVDHLFVRLKTAIQTGELAPGQRLIEADLTKDYGVSRGPLREALRRLASEGVVDFVPNRGAMVKRFSRKEIVDLFKIRQALEGLAAELAATNFTPAQHKAQMHVLRQISDGRLREEMPFSEENRSFHNVILELCDNAQLDTLIQQLQLPLLRYQIRGALDSNYLQKSRDEHAAIAAAILANDPKQAEKRMQRHLGQAAQRLMALPDLFP
jgi:DNA-binding GntR family transcriptional regulator